MPNRECNTSGLLKLPESQESELDVSIVARISIRTRNGSMFGILINLTTHTAQQVDPVPTLDKLITKHGVVDVVDVVDEGDE